MKDREPPWTRDRRLETRIEAETDSAYGYNPYSRPFELHLRYGVINLDKHRGPSSHELAATVRKIIGLNHVGHGGTLVPDGEIPPSPACFL